MVENADGIGSGVTLGITLAMIFDENWEEGRERMGLALFAHWGVLLALRRGEEDHEPVQCIVQIHTTC